MLNDILIPLLPLLAFAVNGIFGRWLKERAAYISIAAVLASFALAVGVLLEAIQGYTLHQDLYSWIAVGDFRVAIGLKVDALVAVMLVVVTSVSSLVHIYSIGYMHGDRGYARFFAFLSLFTFSMLMLVLSNNFLQLYIFWEAVGLCSYLLIGHWYERKSASDAAVKAFVVNRVGDFAFALGILLLYVSVGTLDYEQVFAALPGIAGQTVNLLGFHVDLITLIGLLLFGGAVGKSAQIPLHVWLPDAMEGPTPVSALIHAATMVTAGVFMVARIHPVFDASATAMATVAVVGGVTALFAASIALVQNDIKRIVAYSTVSQLGYMFLACGVGAYGVAIFHLMTHAYFKGLLFLGSGSVIHALGGEQDIRKMGGLKDRIPSTYKTFLIASLSISGIPIFAGFFSKDAILWRAFEAAPLGRFLWVLGTAAALMTAFYSFRLIYMVFHGKPRMDEETAKHVHESPPVMTVPLWILAVLSVAAGWVGIPLVHGGDMIGAFLSPVFQAVAEPAHAPMAMELGVMGLSVAVAVGGILLARSWYISRPQVPERMASRFPGLYQLLLNKYWVDEAYDRIFVQPIKNLADRALWAFTDVKVIDGTVNGVGAFFQRAAGVIRRIQTGLIPHYAYSMALGIFVVLALYLVGRG